MDIICIKELTISARIGIHDWEKARAQNISVNLKMAWDIQVAAQQDDIQYALNYQSVAERVKQIAQAKHYHLIETLAEDVANALILEFKTPKVDIEIYKPYAVADVRHVGVMITRTAE